MLFVFYLGKGLEMSEDAIDLSRLSLEAIGPDSWLIVVTMRGQELFSQQVVETLARRIKEKKEDVEIIFLDGGLTVEGFGDEELSVLGLQKVDKEEAMSEWALRRHVGAVLNVINELLHPVEDVPKPDLPKHVLEAILFTQTDIKEYADRIFDPISQWCSEMEEEGVFDVVAVRNMLDLISGIRMFMKMNEDSGSYLVD